MFIAVFHIIIFLCTVTTVWVIYRSSFWFWPLPLWLQNFSKSYSDCQTVGRIPWKEDLTIATSLCPQQNKNRKGNVCPNASLRHLTEYLFLVHGHLLTHMKSQGRKVTCMTVRSQKKYSFISCIAKNLSEEFGEHEKEPQPADHGDIHLQEGAEPHGSGNTAFLWVEKWLFSRVRKGET